MKIAIYNDEDIHFEMIGYLLEYCYSYDVIVHIYSSFKNGPYITWYNRFFDRPIDWKTDNILNSTIEYDIVFLVTDDNPKYKLIKDRYINKTISIEHWYNSRNDVKYKVGTRLFFNRPNIPYATPCYNIISEKDKFELLQIKNRLQVVFVGQVNFPNSFTLAFFNHFEDIDFHIIIWNIKDSYTEFLKKVPNLHIHIEIDTEEMIIIMKESHYVFFNPSYMEGYPAYKTSSTLHLALSTLVKPIIPQSWNNNYNFNSNLIIEYKDIDYSRPNKQLNLSFDDYFQSLKFMSFARRNEIAHRNIVFDNMITSIAGSTPNSLKSSCLSKVFSRLSLNYPNVFVGFECCFDNSIINDFREIHMFNSVSTEVQNGNKIYNYSNGNTTDLITDIVDSFIEPVVFFIDENFYEGPIYYNRLLSILFKREFDDIIVFNFTLTVTDFIPNNKNYSIYSFDCELLTILVPKHMEIPNEVIQVWINKHNRIPIKVFENIKREGPEYNYTLYIGPMVSTVVDNFNPIFRRKYDVSLKYQHKSDLLRMVLLYNRGGVYMDIDYEPFTSINNTIKRNELQPTFVTVLASDNENNGINICLIACTKYNKIMSLILNYMHEFDIEKNINDCYVLNCLIVQHVLKTFMGVQTLSEGFYEIGGERILLLNEKLIDNEFKITYKYEIFANSRYSDYPWNLNDNEDCLSDIEKIDTPKEIKNL
jgi:hypothetical protein